MSPEIILVNYYFLLLIFNLVPLRYVSTKIITANVNSRYHNVEQLSNKHETECPRGWTRYERTKSCFHVIERRMRWSEAERACANFGGHLASITDEYENMFAFNLAKDANLSTPTLWLGRLVKLTRTGAYEWNDGAIGRHTDGFRGELPSGTDLCLTMWLDFDRPEGSWNEWDCNYVSGYSALCKRSLKRTPITTTATSNTRSGSHSGLSYYSRRCCLISSLCHNTSQSCTPEERCIPDDLDCWAKICPNGGIGWCLPLPKI
ncbi:Lectin C-type domain containing protein [Brugia malayi]|uniref:BMA-CLEC-178, isoform b n=2 Tax=Brugia TaxID=6278 RepID=A0A0K0JP38_BRUMA|nr:Lectin C-type domain containing protein [Brugia malayi]CDQ03116.1 BMA-CLEC-178, isoform b [Brugia malayi]VIO95700.1 Lectin C-type domain containing protein [Brugia malayi]